MQLDDLKKKNVLIVSHTFVKGAAQELEDFLVREKIRNLVFIGHPLYCSAQTSSFYKIFEEGTLLKDVQKKRYNLPGVLNYIEDVFYTILFIFRIGIKFDIMIGVDNLNAFSCLISKWLGKGEKVIFYTIDYVPRRFENKLLNSLYHTIDTLCVKWSDAVWNVCGRMLEGREKKGVSQKYRNKQVTVPIGINFFTVGRLPYTEIERRKVIYLGHLLEKQGVQLLIQSAPLIISEVPDVIFEIIGGGEYEKNLKKLVEELQVEKYFEFTGLITDRKNVDRRLMKAAVGVAPYVPTTDNFTYYSDPTKPKDYMAFGLPVIITDVPSIAQEIEKRRAGFVIKYDWNMLAEKVIALLKNDNLYQLYRENAIAFASEYDWDKIFLRAFQTV